MKDAEMSETVFRHPDGKLFETKFDVPSDGFIRLVDVMGDESSIVQAARVSYGEGTKKVHEDVGLIRHLMRHRHTTPFEMVELKFHVRVPMDTWRQWIRHRTASVNEYSTRYSEAIDENNESMGLWRVQSKTNKQGSEVGELTFPDRCKDLYEDYENPAEFLDETERELMDHSHRVYKERLEMGVAREQARKDLLLSTYTEAYWKIDLHNLLHFLGLRMDSHAQLEIRQYADIIGYKIVAALFPNVWQAFLDYRFQATYLTRLDTEMLQMVLPWWHWPKSQTNLSDTIRLAVQFGWVKTDKNSHAKPLVRNRERSEFEDKARTKFGIDRFPWDHLRKDKK